MYRRFLIFTTKLLIAGLRLLGRSGSALPGLVIEKLYPGFLPKVLKPVEDKIILVSGTNGKTTTTQMLVQGLRGAGARVVTNTTGSNMTRGLIAALLDDMTYSGRLKLTDWFVFEMDEAYGPVFTKQISPHLVVGLNVLRDQLDRYGEIDTTARLIQQTALKARYFVYNKLDPLLTQAADILQSPTLSVRAFTLKKSLSKQVTNEQSLLGRATVPPSRVEDVCLTEVKTRRDQQIVTFRQDNKNTTLTVPLLGFHNAFNATAVYTVLTILVPQQLKPALMAISAMPIPFGRGEQLQLKDKNVTVALVKNPSGFISNLKTFVQQAQPDAVLFVVNDRFADGRDVSWLWDVPFQGMVSADLSLYASGIRSYDMALRLKHDHLASTPIVSASQAIAQLMKTSHKTIVIIPTYTALFEVRAALAKYGKVPRIW